MDDHTKCPCHDLVQLIENSFSMYDATNTQVICTLANVLRRSMADLDPSARPLIMIEFYQLAMRS